MVERLIGYVVTFVVLAGMGVALPRWFAWRRALINQLQGEQEDTVHA